MPNTPSCRDRSAAPGCTRDRPLSEGITRFLRYSLERCAGSGGHLRRRHVIDTYRDTRANVRSDNVLRGRPLGYDRACAARPRAHRCRGAWHPRRPRPRGRYGTSSRGPRALLLRPAIRRYVSTPNVRWTAVATARGGHGRNRFDAAARVAGDCSPSRPKGGIGGRLQCGVASTTRHAAGEQDESHRCTSAMPKKLTIPHGAYRSSRSSRGRRRRRVRRDRRARRRRSRR